MNFEKFLGFGWKFRLYNVELLKGKDAYGVYHKFICPYYKTYIRGWK